MSGTRAVSWREMGARIRERLTGGGEEKSDFQKQMEAVAREPDSRFVSTLLRDGPFTVVHGGGLPSHVYTDPSSRHRPVREASVVETFAALGRLAMTRRGWRIVEEGRVEGDRFVRPERPVSASDWQAIEAAGFTPDQARSTLTAQADTARNVIWESREYQRQRAYMTAGPWG